MNDTKGSEAPLLRAPLDAVGFALMTGRAELVDVYREQMRERVPTMEDPAELREALAAHVEVLGEAAAQLIALRLEAGEKEVLISNLREASHDMAIRAQERQLQANSDRVLLRQMAEADETFDYSSDEMKGEDG